MPSLAGPATRDARLAQMLLENGDVKAKVHTGRASLAILWMSLQTVSFVKLCMNVKFQYI